MDETLAKLRQEIDKLDLEITDKLNQRASIALQIGQAKNGKVVYRPAREAEVISNVTKHSQGSMPAESLKAIYAEIIAACRNLQQPLKVAYLGPAGTYSHQAAIKQFGYTSKFIACKNIDDVIGFVLNGQANVAIVPLKNSSQGVIKYNQQKINSPFIQVCGQLSLPINHQLLSKTGELETIKVVSAHPQALAQCKSWLAKNLPSATLQPAASNAAAAKQASRHDSLAAIASTQAAKIYKLKILAKDIQDQPNNITDFVVINKIGQ